MLKKYMLDLKKVCAIAKDAGAKILDIYYNASDIDIQRKDDDSPLTIADKAAHDIICAGLEKIDPKYPILSEESTEKASYAARSQFEYYWLVDPLDGTKEFIRRNGEFTVNIALIHQEKVVAGVVYAPCLDEMYWAEEGKGAFMEKDGKTQQINAAEYSLEDEGLNVVCSRSHLNAETQAFVDKLNKPNLVSKGSSLKFLLLATGQAHLYPRVAPTMEWDTAAAQIVLEEAGGKVIQYGKKEAVVYNKENLLNPFFVAYGNVH